ncbi:MAG: hypothetical protein ACKOXK_03900 [Chakrabartia sp.]
MKVRRFHNYATATAIYKRMVEEAAPFCNQTWTVSVLDVIRASEAGFNVHDFCRDVHAFCAKQSTETEGAKNG